MRVNDKSLILKTLHQAVLTLILSYYRYRLIWLPVTLFSLMHPFIHSQIDFA